MFGEGIYFSIKGLQTHNCMSQSGWLLHSICPCGIACLCVGLSGPANVFSVHVCVCLLQYLSHRTTTQTKSIKSAKAPCCSMRALSIYCPIDSTQSRRITQRTEEAPIGSFSGLWLHLMSAFRSQWEKWQHQDKPRWNSCLGPSVGRRCSVYPGFLHVWFIWMHGGFLQSFRKFISP